MKRLSLVLLVLASTLVAVPAWGQTEPASLPAGTVARVWATPILKADFDHWMLVATADEGMPAPGTKEFASARDEVMQLLVSFEWVKGETAMRHITVSDKAVRRDYASEKRQSFPKESDYQEFLRRTHQTGADIRERVRLDLLSNRLRDKIVARAKTDAGKQRLLDRFVKDFTARWRSVTVCGEGYATEDCGRTVPISAG